MLAGAIILAAACLVLWRYLAAPGSAADPAVPIPVTVAKVERSDAPHDLIGIGKVQALNTVNVIPQVSGQIVKVAFNEGQLVHQGDLLIQIDPRPFQAKLQQDEATLAKDTAHRNNGSLNLSRYRGLAASNAISAQMVDTQAASVAQEQATLLADQAQIAQDKLELSYATITAPLTGVAGFRQVDVGNLVAPTDTKPMLTIVQIQPIAVLFSLPQSAIPAIQQAREAAAAAHSALSVEAWSEDSTAKLADGSLETIDNTVNDASGMITLKAIFTNADSRLWAGQFVEARLLMHQRISGVSIPAAAVQYDASGAFVWVVTPAHIAQTRPIKVAETQFGTALVASGLKPGELVVTDGQYGLQPGAAVTAAMGPARKTLKTVAPGQLGITP